MSKLRRPAFLTLAILSLGLLFPYGQAQAKNLNCVIAFVERVYYNENYHYRGYIEAGPIAASTIGVTHTNTICMGYLDEISSSPDDIWQEGHDGPIGHLGVVNNQFLYWSQYNVDHDYHLCTKTQESISFIDYKEIDHGCSSYQLKGL